MSDPYLAIRRAADTLQKILNIRYRLIGAVEPKTSEVAAALATCERVLQERPKVES